MVQQITFEGLPELEKKFKHLTEIIDDRKIVTGLLNVAKIFQEKIKAAAPKGPTLNLVKSVIVKKFRIKIKGAPAVFVAIDRKIAPHAHLVEYGTKGLRYPTKKAKKVKPGEGWLMITSKGGFAYVEHTGQMPANPFFRRTYDKEQKNIIEKMEREIWKVIEKEANK